MATLNEVNEALRRAKRHQRQPATPTIAPQAAITAAQQRIKDVRTQVFAALKIASRLQVAEPLRAQLRKMHERLIAMEHDLTAITFPKI
jgi:hypothetical protein